MWSGWNDCLGMDQIGWSCGRNIEGEGVVDGLMQPELPDPN